MVIRFAIGLSLALLGCPALSFAETDYTAELDMTYSQSNKRIRIDGKTATFRAGGAGLRLQADHDRYGMFYGKLGYGYSPKESASYSGTTLSGPAESLFYGAGYSYFYSLNHRYKLKFSSDYVEYDISGDLEGDVSGLPTVARLTSLMTTHDTVLALRYSINRDLHVTLGIGERRWSIEALAKGTIGDSIGATSEVAASGSDPISHIGIEFKVKNIPVRAFYSHSTLTADNAPVVHGLDIQILLHGF